MLSAVLYHCKNNMNPSTLKKEFTKLLTENILPFWLSHGLDHVNGGIWTGLDEKGNIIETDKSVWFQGRALWVFSCAYEKIFQNEEYLHAADQIVQFLDSYCFDSDGRMFFRVTADGRPVIKRIRYFFSEVFAALGYAAYGRVTGKTRYCDKAFSLYLQIEKLRTSNSLLIPKFNQDVEPSITFSSDMILINMLSELRLALPREREIITQKIADLIDHIEKYFVRDDMKLVLEQCAPDGKFMKDHFEGRLLNPGHAIEGAWFIMAEGIETSNKHYEELGLKMLDWMWDCGWDTEYSGIIQYKDALEWPLSEYHQDMKFWWPQCEASIASLMAYSITKKEKYVNMFLSVNDYINTHFIDEINGEWFGYLHRDGTLATSIKGNMYKGPFHIPRMYMKCIEIANYFS